MKGVFVPLDEDFAQFCEIVLIVMCDTHQAIIRFFLYLQVVNTNTERRNANQRNQKVIIMRGNEDELRRIMKRRRRKTSKRM